MKKFDVLIFGAGIIGASIAYELARQGASVLVVDKRRAGSGASGASAAMLERQLDSAKGDAFVKLATVSLDIFPFLADDIKKRTGIDIGYERNGILEIAASDEDEAVLKNQIGIHSKNGWQTVWKTAAEIEKDVPALRKGIRGGAFYAGDGQVHGHRFLTGLLAASQLNGAIVMEEINNIDWILENDAVTGVRCNQEVFTASHYVIASGAWSDQLVKPFDLTFHFEPVRGQMLVFDAPDFSLPFPVYTRNKGYVTPKRDGTVLVGATMERAGFNESTTEDARKKLLDLTRSLMPSLLNYPVRAQTSGLRPKSPDELPLIGPLPERENILLAAGHYRNGFLLAPGTARAVSALILNRQSPLDLAPFSPHRALARAV